MKEKAVVLLSGGLDSAVTLYMAGKAGYDCRCLVFDYGQRHKKELALAKKIARAAGADITVVKLDFPWKGSSLTDRKEKLPLRRSLGAIKSSGVPSTYVPARNTVFLSVAASFAEAIGARAIFIGAHSQDSSGYPDCRKEYLDAFALALRLGTKAGLEGQLKLKFPLIKRSKADIIRTGASLGVPFGLTWSCYAGEKEPCDSCDSCVLRAKGFKEAGLADPALETISAHSAAVAEVFSSFQGEGVFVGARQIFVRFGKCNMSCDFCDTPRRRGRTYTAKELINRIRTLEKRCGPHHSVSLTGGEPLMHAEFLKELLPMIKGAGLKTYLETNGTLPRELKCVIGDIDIIAMDFKLPSSTKDRHYWREHAEFLGIARSKKVFVKAVVTPSTSKDDIARAVALIKDADYKIPFIIQPATPVKASDEAVPLKRLGEIYEMTKRDIADPRIVPQVHKALGIR
jgi:7-cyano-7-deazaguanine synthase